MKIIFILLVVAPFNLLAQSSPLMATDKTSVYPFLNMYDLSGKLIPTNISSYSEGYPYVTESFNKGVVEFSNGMQSTDLVMNYNLFDNTIRFKRDSNEYIMMDAVKGFVLTDSYGVKYEFKNNFPNLEKNSSATFYQVLSKGRNFQLLKHVSKKIVSTYHYGISETNKIESYNQYYLYDITNAKLIKTKKSVTSIITALPFYEKAIDRYLNQNEVNLKKEKQLIGLIEHLNSMPIDK
jgi:hypothetical protein